MPIVVEGDPKGSKYTVKNRRTQRPPYVKPLPYELKSATFPDRSKVYSETIIENMAYPFTTEANYFRLSFSGRNNLALTQNKALDKLYEAMNQASDLLVAMKERQSTVDLITSNLGKLVRIARAIKRRDPNIVRAIKQRKSKGYDVAKDPAGLWLEYHFAIVPTIMDIQHAAGILGYEFPSQVFSYTSGSNFNDEYIFYQEGGYPWGHKQYCTSYNQYIVKIGGKLKAVNPNVQLVTMLGFGQPLSVAWEMTPFSWFVDYFVNVGQLVTNMEPRFPGITFEDQYTTTLLKSQFMFMTQYPHMPREDIFVPGSAVHMKRELGWPEYLLTFSSPLNLKFQQCSYIGAVLVSLLESFVTKKR